MSFSEFAFVNLMRLGKVGTTKTLIKSYIKKHSENISNPQALIWLLCEHQFFALHSLMVILRGA